MAGQTVGRDGIRRSVDLFKAFRLEQTQPEVFYSTLAADTIRGIERHRSVDGAVVLDIGAGRPQFADAFVDAGSIYAGLDPDVSMLEFATSDRALPIAGDGLALPFRSGCADIVLASNVLEHVPDPAAFGNEMMRVTKIGGYAVISYTNWLSPWGGHETSPWHYLGGEYAVRRYRRKHGKDPKNRVDTSLFRLSVADALRMAPRIEGADVLDVRPRYWPGWSRPMLKVPGLREVATWNLWITWRKHEVR